MPVGILAELVARLVGHESARQVAREGIASIDDRFELGVGQRAACPLLEERPISRDRRQHRRHGKRFHEIVRMRRRARYIDARKPPGSVDADRIADRKRRVANRVSKRLGAIVLRGDPRRRDDLGAREPGKERCRSGFERRTERDHRRGGRGRLIGRSQSRREREHDGQRRLDRVDGVAFGLADPALVEDDQPNGDAGAMLDVRAAENGDLNARTSDLGDRDIAAGTAAVVRESRRHNRNAASAVGKTEERGAKVASAGMAILAAAFATAEGRIDQDDGRTDIRRQPVVNEFGIVCGDVAVRHESEQCGAAGIAFVERYGGARGDRAGGEHADARRRFEHMVVGRNRRCTCR